MMNEFNQFVETALSSWRSKRDVAFANNNLNLEAVYAIGDFESLPADCLMAVCYVDAYASMKAKLDSTILSTKEIINELTNREDITITFVHADASYCVKNEKENEGIIYENSGPAVIVAIKGEFRDGMRS